MKKIICFLIISAFLALSITGCSDKSESSNKSSDIKYDENNVGEIYAAEIDPEHIAIGESEIKYVDDEVLLVAKNEVSKNEIEALAKDINAEIVGYIEQTGDYQIKFSQAMTEKEVEDLIYNLKGNSLIESASFNYVFDIDTTSVDYNINDGEKWTTSPISNLWQGPLLALLDNKAWGVNAINAPIAWLTMDIIKDDINPINVGLIDKGFDETHEDLAFKQVFYENWSNGVDIDDETHGTHVAGTMAARGDNKEGICGVYPYGNNRLYASGNGIYDYSTNGSFFTSVMAQKIAYSELILRNVKVINQSQGFNWYLNKFTDNDNQTDYNALLVFWNNKNFSDYFTMSKELGGFFNRLLKQGYDFIIVSAAGNDSDRSIGHLDSTLSSWNNMIKFDDYPDVYNRIIVVGSVGKSLDISDFSNAGERVDIYAPGEKIYSTVPGGDYSNDKSGTSMAAPHVSGVAANVWSINNGLTGAQVKEIVCSSTLKNSKDGVPVVDCAAAVRKAIDKNANLHKDDIHNGGILGWVYDGTDRTTPIKDVSVVPYSNGIALTDYGVTTDKYGHFELIIPSGDYELHFTKGEDYDEKILSATASNGEVNYLNEGIDEVIGLFKSGTSNTYSWIMEPTYEYNDVQILECFFGQPYGRAFLARAIDSYTYMPTEELKGLFVAETESSKNLIDLSGNTLLYGNYSKICAMTPPSSDYFYIYINSDSGSYWIDENYKMVKDNGLGLGGMFDYNYYYNIEDSSIWLCYASSPEKTDETELFQISAPIESVRVVQGERKYDTEIYTDLPGTGKFGLISYGNITVPMEYDGYYRLSNAFYYFDSVYGFSEEGRIVFYKDNKIYVFDENGKCYSEGKYDVDENANQEKYYYQGYLPVSLDGKWGYIDIYGNEVVSCQFEDVTSVYDGKAWVKKGGKWGVIELTNGYIEETPSTKMPYEEVVEPVTANKGVIATHLEKAPSGFTPIYTADELSKIQTHSFAQYILMNDIDLSNWGNWIPIGTSDSTGFSGVFDGNGYNILNINVDISKNGENAYGGLFAKCRGGEIRNLGIVGGKISVKSYSYNMTAGGIAGYCVFGTKISNCFNTATIVATSLGNNGTSMNNYARIGGIIGDGDAIIENCFNTGNLTASDAYAISYVGGIAGTFSNSSMKNVYNIGNLKSSAHYGSKYDNIGGLIGYEGNSNELINCYYLNTAANPIGYAFTKNLSEKVKELTSSEIKLQSAFIGFDFDNIWAISEDVNNSYPYLKTVNFISIAPTENVSENTPTFTVEQIRNTIVGSWTGFPNFYTFSSDGTCTMFGNNQNKGTYRITDDKTLYISFPWMSESYEWNENSLTDKKGWYMTEYMLIIKGQEIGRE